MLNQEPSLAYERSSMEDLVTRPCAYCHGTREVGVGELVPDYQTCPVCEGHGNIRVPSEYIKCHQCDGTGKEDVGECIERFAPCEKCHGIGWAPPPPVYR
jgi:DnaJ-class molecular chaperone